MNETLIFLKNCPLGLQYTYSSEFSIGQNTSKIFLLIWYKTALFLFKSSMSENFSLGMNFQHQKNLLQSSACTNALNFRTRQKFFSLEFQF